MRAIDVVRRLCPRARPAYLAAFEAGDDALAEYGITTPLRLAHFLAQVCHETGGLTIERESMRYSAKRIMEIFGVGRHSAGVTSAEAKRLAGDERKLSERVYGLGNPHKARELGNVEPGDGYAYRGGGLMQTTGRGAYHRLGERLGLGALFEMRPEAVTDADHALLPALAEWRESGCNALADKNNLNGITRKINGGYNGAAERTKWFNRSWKMVREEKAASWQAAEADPDIQAIQEDLVALGYDLKTDGRKGPATTKAITDFQRKNGLVPDGIAGEATRGLMRSRRQSPAPVALLADPDSPPAGTAPLVAGGVAGGAAKSLADMAPVLQDQASQLMPFADALPVVRGVVVALSVVAGGLVLYGIARQLFPRIFRRRVEVMA